MISPSPRWNPSGIRRRRLGWIHRWSPGWIRRWFPGGIPRRGPRWNPSGTPRRRPGWIPRWYQVLELCDAEAAIIGLHGKMLTGAVRALVVKIAQDKEAAAGSSSVSASGRSFPASATVFSPPPSTGHPLPGGGGSGLDARGLGADGLPHVDMSFLDAVGAGGGVCTSVTGFLNAAGASTAR